MVLRVHSDSRPTKRPFCANVASFGQIGTAAHSSGRPGLCFKTRLYRDMQTKAKIDQPHKHVYLTLNDCQADR